MFYRGLKFVPSSLYTRT